MLPFLKYSFIIDNDLQEFCKANNYFREANIDQAKQKYTDAVLKLKQCDQKGVEHDHSIALSNLGVLQFAEGRYDEAKTLLTEALNQRMLLLHQNDFPDPSLSSLSIALKRDIMFHRVPDSQKVMAAELKEHGNIDSIAADLLNNLEVSGDLDEAKRFYEESLNLRKVGKTLCMR